MANDFSGDANCKALWRFESGALTTDSKGSNTLTNVNTVAENTTDYKEGACSADFELSNSEYFYRTDADLDSGFPFKSEGSTKKISLCMWIRLEVLPSATATIVSKYDSTGDRSFWAYVNTSNVVGMTIGYNGGSSSVLIWHGSNIVIDRWYHVGMTYQDSDGAYRIRIWDDTTGAILGTDKTGTSGQNININTQPFRIGANSSSNNPQRYWDGEMDEVVVFNDILSVAEIDQIRAGTYGAAGGTPIPVFMQQMNQFNGGQIL